MIACHVIEDPSFNFIPMEGSFFFHRHPEKTKGKAFLLQVNLRSSPSQLNNPEDSHHLLRFWSQKASKIRRRNLWAAYHPVMPQTTDNNQGWNIFPRYTESSRHSETGTNLITVKGPVGRCPLKADRNCTQKQEKSSEGLYTFNIYNFRPAGFVDHQTKAPR